jgi:outer membrane biosynthesis protein TonB
MVDNSSVFQRKVKNQGIILTVVVHTLFILLLMLKVASHPKVVPPPPEGILVNLGLPDVGQGTDNTPGPPVPVPEPPVDKPKPKPTKEPTIVTKPTKPTPSPKPVQKPTVTTEDPNAIAIRQQKEREKQQREESDRIAREENAAKQRADDERKRKDAEAKAMKDQIGGLFGGGGKGSGKGNTGKPGNQGDPDGDPNAKNLNGVTTGTGSVGGNLGSRNLRSKPSITDNSQDEGTVVLYVCVDKDGNVISADFTQKGSTTSSANLVSLARSNAMRWKFDAGDIDKQCGTITYRFRVQ